MMVDLHTHILPGIDDGAGDTAISFDMLRIAAASGTTCIFATPHFIPGSLENDRTFVIKKYEELLKAAAEKTYGIKILPGSEVFISPDVPALFGEGKICTLNHSSYLLVEFPMMSIPSYAGDILYQLQLKGCCPIIAHPERNREIAANPGILYDFVRRGILSQVNSTSLTGVYGKKVRETAFTLLRHNMVHFVASDAHTCHGRSPKLARARELVEAAEGSDTAVRLFETNGLAVEKNVHIEVPEPEPVRNDKSFKNFVFEPLKKMLMSMRN